MLLPQPLFGTQPPTAEHFSPAAQSAAVVHFGAQVPLLKHAPVEPHEPTPWQL
jgi:hypothetical protein